MALPRVATRWLVYSAFGGGIAVASFGLYVKTNIARTYAAQPYYQEAIRILRKSPGALHLLGEPIVDKEKATLTMRESL